MPSEKDNFDLSDLANQFTDEADESVRAFEKLTNIVGGEREAKCLQVLKHAPLVIRTKIDPSSTHDVRIASELDFDIGEAAMSLCSQGFAAETAAPSDLTVQSVSITEKGKQVLSDLGL